MVTSELEKTYQPNSNKFKAERCTETNAKVEKIISGGAKSKKRTDIRKFADVFLSEDIKEVKTYIVAEVLIPTVKKAISDIITTGINMLLYGDIERGGNRVPATKISYNKCYERDNNRRAQQGSQAISVGYRYDDIILESRFDANEVLSRMDELIASYGLVSVGDLYELVGIDGDYTDNKYGWTNIRNASAVRVKDGYLLKLPKALPLN